jgi:hypothetical protein
MGNADVGANELSPTLHIETSAKFVSVEYGDSSHLEVP